MGRASDALSVGSEFELYQRLSLIPRANIFTHIAKYWSVPGIELSVLLNIGKKCLFHIQTKKNKYIQLKTNDVKFKCKQIDSFVYLTVYLISLYICQFI